MIPIEKDEIVRQLALPLHEMVAFASLKSNPFGHAERAPIMSAGDVDKPLANHFGPSPAAMHWRQTARRRFIRRGAFQDFRDDVAMPVICPKYQRLCALQTKCRKYDETASTS
jgi:hypothetical protein